MSTESAEATIATVRNLTELITRVWSGDVTLPEKLARSLYDAKSLKAERIRMVDNYDGTFTFTRSNPVAVPKPKHEYIMPPCAHKVKRLLNHCVKDGASYNFMLTGHKGTGKTEFVKEMARMAGYDLFQFNGSVSTVDSDLIGNIEVTVDKATKQSITSYKPGILIQAMTAGTKVDENGYQVLDDDGRPIVIGKPGMFFMDEFATVPGSIITGVFQHVLEIPRELGQGRSLTVNLDGNPRFQSHPAFVMFFAGNTAGKGTSDTQHLGYTSQDNIHDDSTLDRMSLTFEFEYNEEAERKIAISYLHDEVEAENLMRFRDEVRRMFDDGRISTLLSTRGIVGICDIAEQWMQDKDCKYPLVEAIVDTLFSRLDSEELPGWNQTMKMIWGYDYLEEKAKAKAARAKARSRR